MLKEYKDFEDFKRLNQEKFIQIFQKTKHCFCVDSRKDEDEKLLNASLKQSYDDYCFTKIMCKK
jgi:hypothetical protein